MERRKLADDKNLNFLRLLNELIAQVFPCGPDDIEQVAYEIGIDGKIE